MDYPEWDNPDSKTVNHLSFEIFTSEEIKRLSVKPVTNSQTFDALLHPQPNGLHDLALGRFTTDIFFFYYSFSLLCVSGF